MPFRPTPQKSYSGLALPLNEPGGCDRRIANNSIPATALKDIKAPNDEKDRPEDETPRGLRVADKGYLNTAVIRSEITYIDGDNGGQFSHGQKVQEILIAMNSVGVQC